MKYLELHECGLQDDVLVHLTNGQRPLLETLDLSSNFLSVQGVLQLVAGHWPNLSVLNLRSNRFITNAALVLQDNVLDEAHTLREVSLRSIIIKWPAVQLLLSKGDIGLSE